MRNNPMALGIANGVAAGALWGVVFLAPAVLHSFNALQLSAGRYLVYGLIAVILLLPRWKRLAPQLGRAEWMGLLWLSLAGNLVYFVLLANAVQWAGGAAASLIVGLIPVVVTLAGVREKGAVPLRKLAPALLLCLAGVALVGYEALQAEHQNALDERVRADRVQTEARTLLDGIDAELRNYEQTRHQRDEQALAQRERISQRKLDQQALVLSAETLQGAVEKAGFVLQDVLNTLPDDARLGDWEQAVHQIDGRMRRLEPVNLAAIHEYGEASQRSDYLDAQHTDLTTALETLEDAIRKIDRETRGRFKDTFDRVNAGVQALYPRLFGGGHAYLELTGEDLLDTGVTIMARPPGKRVSSISLLSGGEKAMTAVALVFAIFQLNPAPFCLLDEVDAPLDEANVGRLANMVKEMSEKVQFLFVSHNKATMEAAHQLSGVTMREPGVSRLVSVDLEEAARLAGAA